MSYILQKEVMDSIKKQLAAAEDLAKALDGILPFVTDEIVDCHGSKCRQINCEACFSEPIDGAEAIEQARAALSAWRKARGGVMEDTDLVTVCAKCLQATCWQGLFYCDDYKTAGTVEKTVAELRKLNLEHPCYWGNQQAIKRGKR